MFRRTFNKIVAGFIAAFTMPYTTSGRARRKDILSSLKDYTKVGAIDIMFDKNLKTMAINGDIYEGITPREYIAICQHFKKTYRGKVYVHDTTKVPPRVVYDGLKKAPADSYITKFIDKDGKEQYYPVFRTDNK